MSDKAIRELLEKLRDEIPSLFRVCESIAMLDMVASFGQLVVTLLVSLLISLAFD
jgi:DNA mismatch repair protein MSH4